MKSSIEFSLERASDLLCGRMGAMGPMRAAVLRDLRLLTRDRVEIAGGRSIVHASEKCPQIYLMEGGWVFRSRALACGRRQIVSLAMPGDLLCIDSVFFKRSSFELFARTPVTALRIDAPGIVDLFERHSGLAAALAWTVGQEESVLAERVVSLGRRDSLEKLAHALCELAARLTAIGQMRGNVIETPLNQEDFADILGISVIHVNRTFRRLSEENVAEYRKGQIELLDRERLAELASFDPAYLHFD